MSPTPLLVRSTGSGIVSSSSVERASIKIILVLTEICSWGSIEVVPTRRFLSLLGGPVRRDHIRYFVDAFALKSYLSLGEKTLLGDRYVCESGVAIVKTSGSVLVPRFHSLSIAIVSQSFALHLQMISHTVTSAVSLLDGLNGLTGGDRGSISFHTYTSLFICRLNIDEKDTLFPRVVISSDLFCLSQHWSVINTSRP